MSHDQVIEQVQVEVFNSTSIACELDPAKQATKLCVLASITHDVISKPTLLSTRASLVWTYSLIYIAQQFVVHTYMINQNLFVY